MTNLLVNNNNINIFTSSSSKTGSGIANFVINSGTPGFYNVMCWTLTNQGVGYSQPFELTNSVFNVTIKTKTQKEYSKDFKFKAAQYLPTPVNFGNITIDVRTLLNDTITGIKGLEVSLEIIPYTNNVEYAEKILPVLVNKMLEYGINYFMISMSDMFITPSSEFKNISESKDIKNISFVLTDEEKKQIKNYGVNELSNFIFSKFGGKIFL